MKTVRLIALVSFFTWVILSALAAVDSREKDLKRLLAVAKKLTGLGESKKMSPAQKQKRIKALGEEANRIASRLTGLDPKKDKPLFDEKAFALLLEAAQKYDPKFLAWLLETDRKRRIILARVLLKNIQSALYMFEFDSGRLPTEEEGLSVLTQEKPPGPYLRGTPSPLMDPWGNPMVYKLTPGQAKPFALFSAGPDGKPGTPDDIFPHP